MRLTHALTALPFAGVLAGIFFANRVEPYHPSRLARHPWRGGRAANPRAICA
jgi:hypothetical protein